jgi:hypothetical protein
MINRRREAMHGRLFRKLNNVRIRRRGYYLALSHGSPLVLPTKIGNVCNDAGVVAVVPANDTVVSNTAYVLVADSYCKLF